MLDTMNSSETWALTPAELKAVFANAERGSLIVYAVGDLQTTRQIDMRWDDIGDLAYRLWRGGDAYLTQHRLGPHRYEYRCQKR